MNSIGRLEAIWLKRVRRGPMDPVEHAGLVAGRGLMVSGVRLLKTRGRILEIADCRLEVLGEPGRASGWRKPCRG